MDASSSAQTLQQYVLHSVRERMYKMHGPNPSKEVQSQVLHLIALLNSITLAVKKVGKQIRQCGAPRPRSELEPLNEFANHTWVEELLYSQKSCILVSEDLAEPVIVQAEMQGTYAVVFDPLTGLSDPPAPDLGAIFGIFHQLGTGTPCVTDVLQPASNLIGAGYCLYSSCTTLMFSVGDGLHQFTLDSAMNEFILTTRNVKMPFYGTTYAMNEGYTAQYDDETKEVLRTMKMDVALNGAQRTCRYIGSMVADCHRTIMKGGLYAYPARTDLPNGKCRLLYEAGPMAWMVAQAGGHATNGKTPIIDICPSSIHAQVPVFLGSRDEVALCTGIFTKNTWGNLNTDPMSALRRKQSIDEKRKALKNQTEEDEVQDDIICFHLGVLAS